MSIYNTNGSSYSLAIDEHGNLWAWGVNGVEGSLGDGTKIDSVVPVLINANGRMNNAKVVSFSASAHSLAIDEHGNLWSWGYNYSGQLGDGTTTNSLVPIQINVNGRMNNAKLVSIAAGYDCSLAIDEYGNLWSWGYNNYGQLGDGSTTNSLVPIQINANGRMNNAKVVSFSASAHSLAIDEHGNLWSWGYNYSGQLGDGTTTNRLVPVIINTNGRMNNAKVVSVSIGYSHSLAMDEDGNLWSWGYNYYGQLGNGTTTNSLVPIQINVNGRMNNAKVVSVSAGMTSYSLAIDEDGNLWGWGRRYPGQLYIDIAVNTPLQITNSRNVE